MPYNCIKSSNFFSLNILEILDITTNIFLGCQLSFFALANIRLHRYNSFFRLILLLSVDINVNPGPTKVNNNKVPLHVLPFSNCDEPTLNAIVLTTPKNLTIPSGIFSKKKDLHILHLNINNLIPKIDEIRFTAKQSNASIIGISESKLDPSIL